MNKRKKAYFTAEELMKRELRELPTLWNPFLPKVGLVGITGSSDTGKSTLLRQLAIAVCNGSTKFLGYPLNPAHRSAIYISTEDSEDAVSVCLKKQFGDGLNAKDLPGLLFVFNQDNPVETACEIMESRAIDLLIIDAWADLFNGNTNDVSHTRKALNELNKIAIENKCLVIILHHTVKNSEYNRPDKNKLNGSQGIEAKLRVLLELRPRNTDERILSVLKGNYISGKIKNKSIVLEFSEDRLLFRKTGEIDKNSIVESGKGAFSKDTGLAKRIKHLKDQEGLSFPKILTIVKAEMPGENQPSLTTVKNLYRSVSQSAA